MPVWQTIDRRCDPTRVLTLTEVRLLLADLRARVNKRVYGRKMVGQKARHHINLAMVNLAVCCGLRATEIAGVKWKDVTLTGEKPSLRIRKEVAKGKKKARIVPLWWNSAMVDELSAWRDFRSGKFRGLDRPQPRDPEILEAPIICQPHTGSRGGTSYYAGEACRPNSLTPKFKTILKNCGLTEERIEQLQGLHAGRRTFATHALDAGRMLTEVGGACGHGSIGTRSIYLYAHESESHRYLYDGDRHGEANPPDVIQELIGEITRLRKEMRKQGLTNNLMPPDSSPEPR